MSIYLRPRYEQVSCFCTDTDTSSLHKMACGQMAWCSFVEMRTLSLRLENTMSSGWLWL